MPDRDLEAATDKVLAELVSQVLDEIERRGPPADFVTREWLDKTRGGSTARSPMS